MNGQITISFLFAATAIIMVFYMVLSFISTTTISASAAVARAEMQARADRVAALVNLVYLRGGSLELDKPVSEAGLQVKDCLLTLKVGNALATARCLAPAASSGNGLVVSGIRRWFS